MTVIISSPMHAGLELQGWRGCAWQHGWLAGIRPTGSHSTGSGTEALMSWQESSNTIILPKRGVGFRQLGGFSTRPLPNYRSDAESKKTVIDGPYLAFRNYHGLCNKRIKERAIGSFRKLTSIRSRWRRSHTIIGVALEETSRNKSALCFDMLQANRAKIEIGIYACPYI